MNQGFILVKLTSSLKMFYGCNPDFVNRSRISVLKLTTDMFQLSFPYSCLITGFVTRVPNATRATLRCSYVEVITIKTI